MLVVTTHYCIIYSTVKFNLNVFHTKCFLQANGAAAKGIYNGSAGSALGGQSLFVETERMARKTKEHGVEMEQMARKTFDFCNLSLCHYEIYS